MWQQGSGNPQQGASLNPQQNLQSRALELLLDKARGHPGDVVAQLTQWAAARDWTADEDGRLRGYFLHETKGAPHYETATALYVPPGTKSGYFEHQNGADWSGAEEGWFVFKEQDGFVIWTLREPEPRIVAEQRGRQAKARVFTSDSKLREYLGGLFEGAVSEASSVTHAQQIWAIITASKFAERGEAERLFRVSIALHLHGGDIYDKGVECGGYKPLVAAFKEAFTGGGRLVWLEGAGQGALQDGNRAGFVAWSQEFWSAIAKRSSVNEATVGKMFNHNKGYNRGISYAQEAAGLEADPGTVLLVRLLEGAATYDPLGNLITALNQMTLLTLGMKYDDFKKVYTKFEETIKQVYPDGVDIVSAKAKKSLADDYGFE